MKKILRQIFPYWPIFALIGIEAILFFTNYIPGTYLVGWDNLYPELNFSANFERSIYSIWQEYRGLGLLDGLSHAANLIHTLWIFLLSWVIPQNLLRYLTHFLLHLAGGLGVYFLIKKLMKPDQHSDLLAFLGALFYQYNLVTVQMFYMPLEVFSFHFAFLPILILLILNFLANGKRKSFLYFFVFSVLSIPQAFTPSVFIVYLFAIFIFLAGNFINEPQKGTALKRSFLIILAVFCLNAYWGLPYIYQTIHTSKTIVSSKINQMTTENIFERNQVYGTFKNTALLRGFLLDFVDYQADGQNAYMMFSWREHIKKSLIFIISSLYFLVCINGVLSALLHKKKACYPFVVLFILSFFLLGNDIPIVSLVFIGLQRLIPYFYDIFRFTFTKFSILYVLCYTVFFIYGIKNLIPSIKLAKRLKTYLILVFIFSVFIYSWPSFKGDFLYYNLKNEIPSSYFNLISFFNQREKRNRVAVLPQPSYWGWVYYNWGVRGSGFLWYGLPQASMDGAFYPWSRENENYYWEITQALYSSNGKMFENIFEKYQINYLMVDHSIISPFSPKAVYIDQLEEIITKSEKFRLDSTFGKISVYEVDLKTNPNNFLFLAQDLPVVGPRYSWNNYDRAYEEYGNYIFSSELSLRLRSGQAAVSSQQERNSLSGAGGFFVEGNPEEEKNNKKQQHDDLSISSDSPKISHFSNSSSIFTVNTRNTIPSRISAVKKTILDNLSSGPKFGEIIAAPNQPAERLIESPEKALSQGLVKNLSIDLIKPIYAKDNIGSSQSTINNLTMKPADASDFAEATSLKKPMAGKQFNNLIYYPFRSLFTGRKQEELEFEVEDTKDYFSFKTQIPKELVGGKLVIPAINEEEITEIDENDFSNTVEKLPQIYLDGELIQVSPLSEESLPSEESSSEVSLPLSYIKEGNLEIKAPKIKGYYSYDSDKNRDLLKQTPKTCDLLNKGKYKQDELNEGGNSLLRLTSVNSSNCLDFDLSSLSRRIGYLVGVESRYIEGKSLSFAIVNKSAQRVDLETYLPKNDKINTSYFIIPPMEQYGLGYSLHFDNISIGRVKTVNDLGRITVNPIPYRFLTGLKIVKGNSNPQPTTYNSQLISVDHPNPSLYLVNIGNRAIEPFDFAQDKQSSNNLTLVLSQSFDSGWKAYEIQNNLLTDSWYMKLLIPVFGKELKNHVLVNNWENGWQLDNETMKQLNSGTIVVIYLPQYLEYLGFLLVILTGFILVRKNKYRVV